MIALMVVASTHCSNKSEKVTAEAAYRLIQVTFLVCNVLKECYFARSINFFQSNLYIINRTVKGMLSFTILMFFFSMSFSMMYMGAGVNTPGFDDHTGDDDYPGRSAFERFLMFGMSQSVGDLNLPEFEKWTEDKIPKTNPFSSSLMIILGLTVNFGQIVIMVIVILNLLIAVISEEYEKARANQTVARYLELSEMILESIVHKAYGFRNPSNESVGMVTI